MQLNRKKPVACMLELIRQNIWCFLGAMLGTVMMVLISFATPVLLAETVDSVLGTVPSTLPDWLLQPIRALGGTSIPPGKPMDYGRNPGGAEPAQWRIHLF